MDPCRRCHTLDVIVQAVVAIEATVTDEEDRRRVGGLGSCDLRDQSLPSPAPHGYPTLEHPAPRMAASQYLTGYPGSLR